MSSCEGSGVCDVIGPGGCLVVAGAGFQAAVLDADEAVADLAEGGVAALAAGALLVVAGAGAGGCGQRGQGPGVQGVGEPAAADESRQDDFAAPGRAGDRAGPGVVLAGPGGGAAAGRVTGLGEHPGAVDGPDAGLGQVDLSVRVLEKMGLHLDFQPPDLLVEGDQHGGGGAGGGGAGGGDRGGLGQLRAAERVFDRLGPGGDVVPAGPVS